MIDEFLDYLRYERNYSALTVENYGKDLADLQAYFEGLDEGISWTTLDADVIRGWMEHMMDRGNAATSVNRRLSAVRTFFRYARSRGIVGSNPAHNIEGPKKQKPLPQFVKEREMDELLETGIWGDEYKDVRARTLLLVFYSTGMRLSELINLDDSMVDFTTCEIKVTGKRDKQRIIPFGEELRTTLQEYIARRDADTERATDALFVTSKGERMNRNQVRYEVSKALARVTTLRKRTPHVLRHTFATAMLNHEAGLESVKKLLGHESLSTTEVYTHATFEQLKRIYNNAHPRA
jgi:integrase/recombinase XerC